MRYVDDELPWFWRIPVRAGVILSPRLRHRVHLWRRFSNKMSELFEDSEPDIVTRPLEFRTRIAEPDDETGR